MIARTRTVTLALQASDEASGTWAYYVHIKNARSFYAIHPSACKKRSTQFISTIVHRTGPIRGCWNRGKAPGATVHYRPVLANDVSPKRTFPIGSAKALRHTVTICQGENDPHAKSQEGFLSRSLRSCAAPP